MDKIEGKSEIREAKWCDHVRARGEWLIGSDQPTIIVNCQPVHIVVEEGIVKILCRECWFKGIQVPLNPPDIVF